MAAISKSYCNVAEIVVRSSEVLCKTASVVLATGSLGAAALSAAGSLNKDYRMDLTPVLGPENPCAVISVIGFVAAATLWKVGDCIGGLNRNVADTSAEVKKVT